MKRLLLVLFVSFILTGCEYLDNEEPEISKIFDLEVSEISIADYDVSEEVLEIFENYEIKDFIELNDQIFVVYIKDEMYQIVSLSYAFEINYTISDLPYVERIYEAHDNHIFVRTYGSTNDYILFDDQGEEIFTANDLVVIETTDHSTASGPVHIGDNEYVYVRRIRLPDLNRYAIMQVGPMGEREIYSFGSRRFATIDMLEDNSFILSYRDDFDDSHVYHISFDGEIIHQETQDEYVRISQLNDGYLLRANSFTEKRDFESETIWTYNAEGYLNIIEEKDNSIVFHNYRDQYTYNIVEIDNEGNVTLETVPDNNERQQSGYEVSEDLFIKRSIFNDDEHNEVYGIYGVDGDDTLLWDIYYDHRVDIIYEEELFYVHYRYHPEDMILLYNNLYHVDVYDYQGNFIRQDEILGQLRIVKGNGNYIILANTNTETGIIGPNRVVQEITPSGDIVWETPFNVEEVIIRLINDDLIILSSYGYCYYEPWLCEQYYTTRVLNGQGEVTLYLTEKGSTSLNYHDDEYLYFNSTTDKKIYVYDYDLNLVEEYSYIYQDYHGFIGIIEDKLTIIKFPYNLTGFPWTGFFIID